MKECYKCGEEKPLSAFHRRTNRNGTLGYLGLCKACNIAKVRQWQKDNKERYNEYQKKYQNT
jgi:hypothetical protein